MDKKSEEYLRQYIKLTFTLTTKGKKIWTEQKLLL